MRGTQSIALVTALVLGMAASSAAQTKPAKPSPVLTNLLEEALADDLAPGVEIVMSYVELPPHTTLDRHWHPGEEFIYILEGKVELLVDGEEPITGEPGTVGHVPFKTLHSARTGDESAKAVVFRVHKKGEPVRYLEKGGSANK